MGKNLDIIKDRLGYADSELEIAEEVSRNVGDKKGSQKINKIRENVKKLQKDFENM